jgi:cell wall assembly regulator SMI1
MNELIAELDGYLARCRPDYYQHLLPGVDEIVLGAFQEQLRSELPPVFHLLYKWRNGQNPNCSGNLIDNWMFSPLEEVISTKEMLDGMIGTDFEEPTWWSRGWIPFLSNGGGDHLCLDLTAEFGGVAGQLLTFWHDWGDRSIKFASMEAWLQAVVKALAVGS